MNSNWDRRNTESLVEKTTTSAKSIDRSIHKNQGKKHKHTKLVANGKICAIPKI